ncbi:MAG: type I-C CRISPR-associated protein Cas8c/Csd1 [Candidatus Omnitrophota bacterium]|nr:type I-C CRISPR-associated protein Cas8c/Csd1 [Candidatus Omnitrophota bacterium]
MIAELVRQYDTLKRCNEAVPDPYFDELGVWIEIVLKSDDSFRVNWLGKPKDASKDKKTAKEEACKDMDCPVTEKSVCRSSGNDSPHGLVDNATWIFGKFATEKQRQKLQAVPKKPVGGKQRKEKIPPDEARRQAYLSQTKAFYDRNPETLTEVKEVHDLLSCDAKRDELWIAVEKLLKDKIVDGRGVKLFEKDQRKWQDSAKKKYIRWVVERMGESGKPVNALGNVKKEWKAFQEGKNEWWITSLVDGQRKPARILHPKIKKSASLISFNNAATYCGHLSPEYRGKPGKGEEETDGSSLPAQVGFEEAEKYTKALDWLIENSSVKFGGGSVNCIWVDKGQSDVQALDYSAYEIVKPQDEKSIFTRGKAKGSKGQVLADSGDFLKALQRFRSGQQAAGYRDKRFYLLSLLLRQKGRHAILGSYVGTMGLLDDNADKFIRRTKILIPPQYLNKKDEAREFCPTLMDILSAAGIKSEKKTRLVWDREVIEVIVAGRPLPADLCRLVIQKAIKDKHLERSEKKRTEYRALLAIAAGCARHYLTAIMRKEGYGMELDTSIRDAGYLVGRLFALCENIQKRGRDWGPTLSDKLFSAAIDMPRQTLVQLYKNCLCYPKDISKANSECFEEIFNKVKLNDGDSGQGEVIPENGVEQFAFMLGYWHQRRELRPKAKKESDGDNNNENEPQTNE